MKRPLRLKPRGATEHSEYWRGRYCATEDAILEVAKRFREYGFDLRGGMGREVLDVLRKGARSERASEGRALGTRW